MCRNIFAGYLPTAWPHGALSSSGRWLGRALRTSLGRWLHQHWHFLLEGPDSIHQWIGLIRKISTGNHRFSHEIWGFRGSIFPETLGFWGPAMTRWLCSSMVWKPETGAPVATLNILQTYPPVLQLGHGKSHMRSTHFPWSSSALALPFRCSWSFIMFDTSSDPKIAIWTNTRSDSNAMQYDAMQVSWSIPTHAETSHN